MTHNTTPPTPPDDTLERPILSRLPHPIWASAPRVWDAPVFCACLASPPHGPMAACMSVFLPPPLIRTMPATSPSPASMTTFQCRLQWRQHLRLLRYARGRRVKGHQLIWSSSRAKFTGPPLLTIRQRWRRENGPNKHSVHPGPTVAPAAWPTVVSSLAHEFRALLRLCGPHSPIRLRRPIRENHPNAPPPLLLRPLLLLLLLLVRIPPLPPLLHCY